MGFFKKKGEFVDLGERYRKQQERVENISSDMNASRVSETPNVPKTSISPFPFFPGFGANATPVSNSNNEQSLNFNNSALEPEEKRRRLAKRLADMTAKIEDFENQVYHLKQRIEVLERKNDV